MDKLLPCPFCGTDEQGPTKLVRVTLGQVAMVECRQCGTLTRASTWNTRHTPAGWHRAIDEALVTHHLGVSDPSDSYEDAKRKLGELIDWHVAVATDPRVNGGYRLVPTSSTTKTP